MADPSTKHMIITAVSKYDTTLTAMGFEVERCDLDKSEPDHASILRHLRWCCGQVVEFAEAGRFDKCHRWLGFIQGSLWVCGLGSISSFREDNLVDR